MTRLSLVALCAGLTALTGRGCQRRPDPERSTAEGIRFVNEAEAAGIRFAHSNGSARPLDILDTTGSGLAWLDYDGDGNMDLFCVGGKPGGAGSDALFRNRGDGTFEDVTRAAGIRAGGYGMGCAVGDYTGDGHPDLYVTRYGANALYRNRGDGTFEETAEAAGVAGKPVAGFPAWSLSAAWFDADRDGYPDLYVTRYIAFGPASRRYCKFGPAEASCPQLHYPAQPDVFYRNRGDGTFEEATRHFGFEVAEPGRGMAVLPFHPDAGGPTALYVANDGSPNFLFVPDSRGRYREVGFASGCAVTEASTAQASMGVDSADVDGDGRQDLIVTSFQNDYNTLYRNRGKLDFTDESSQMGLGAATWKFLAFGCGFLDADLDGRQDVVFANGHVWDNAPQADPSAEYAQTAQLFRNTGTALEDWSQRAGPAFEDKLVGRGVAFADYDNDGDVDIAMSCSGGPVQLWRNDTPRRGHWLQVRLAGRSPDTEALNAQVSVIVAGRTLVQEVHGGRGYLADSERRLTFGLGGATEIEGLKVRWPDGSVEARGRTPADRLLTIRAPAGRKGGRGG